VPGDHPRQSAPPHVETLAAELLARLEGLGACRLTPAWTRKSSRGPLDASRIGDLYRESRRGFAEKEER
jgi:hypothetical protein